MDFRTAVGAEAKALWSGGKGMSLVVVAVGWGLLVGTRMIYPVILPHLQETYGLSLAVAGLLMTVLWVFGSIGQLPGGVLADRYDERWLLVGSTTVVALALVFVISSSSAVVLFAATALWGLGHSFYPIARITLLADIYADRLGSALGLTMGTGDIGQTVLPPIAAVLTGALAWQAGLGFVAPLLIVVGLLIAFVVPTREAAGNGDTQSLREILGVFGVLREPTMAFMALILFLYIMIWQSFTAFYPTYLTTMKGLSPAVASLLFGFFFAMGVMIKPLAGAAYDRVGMRTSLVGVLVPSIGGLALLPLVDSVWLLLVLTAAISIMLGSGAITQSFLAEMFPEGTQGTGLGVIRMSTSTLGAGGPVLFGVIADYGFFDEGYFMLAAIMVVVVMLTLVIPQQDSRGQ